MADVPHPAPWGILNIKGNPGLPTVLYLIAVGIKCQSLLIIKPALNYRKNSKNWDTLNFYRDCPTNLIVGFYSAILRSKDADRIKNRVDTDQTAP